MKTNNKVRVSSRALQQRIDRKLASDDLRLKKSRTARERLDLGEYWLLNTRFNVVSEKDVDLTALAKEYGALAAWEQLEE
jgi:hypothetical protein